MSFFGFVSLAGTLKASAITRNSSKVPTNGDALPTYRIYGPNGLMTNGTGTASFRNTGTIASTGNTTPITMTTSAAHGLTTGTRVTQSGTGVAAANGSFVITSTGSTTYTLDGTTAGGAGTGGTWNVSGLYLISHSILGADGFAAGTAYSILVSYAISTTSMADLYEFIAA